MKFKKTSKNNKGATNSKRPFFNRIGRNVHVNWTLIIIFSFIMLITSVSLGVLKYFSFDASLEEQITANNRADNNSIETKSLDELLLKYENISKHRSEILKNYVGPRDPSI